MRIMLTGGTGLIGRSLCHYWSRQGHQLWVLSRNPSQVPALCSGAVGISGFQDLDGNPPMDAVINLAGAPIADRPWTKARRAMLWSSRVEFTHDLVSWLAEQPAPPRVLISGSAVGWYGDRGDETLTENSVSGQMDFGSRLCIAWEQEAEKATQLGLRVASLRTAPVLASQGGMLARLLPGFRLGFGCRLGNGQQWMPWIHLHDQVALIDHLLRNEDCSGAFNACAPGLVRNMEFTQALAYAVNKTSKLYVPAWALRLMLGEMAVLLLGGQRLMPYRTQEVNFIWRYPNLGPALTQILSTSP